MSNKAVSIGGLQIGGTSAVRVESMLKSPLRDVPGCLAEMNNLAESGCELVRVAFPDPCSARELETLAAKAKIPLMADIHFNPDLAEMGLRAGIPAIRLNPGNMGSPERLKEILRLAAEKNAVIRIGANGGSLSPSQIAESRGDRAMALVSAVEAQLDFLRKNGFEHIILSAKSTSVKETVRANTILSGRYPYPLHIGITEAGPGMGGIVKSAVGIGLLLSQGIGDTIRVSLTGPSLDEVKTGYSILNALGIRTKGVDIVSCPTCGRRRVDVQALVARLLPNLPKMPDGFKLAVMGCEVNGPREAADADLGISGAPDGFIVFSHGKPVATARTDNLEEVLRTILGTVIAETD